MWAARSTCCPVCSSRRHADAGAEPARAGVLGRPAGQPGRAGGAQAALAGGLLPGVRRRRRRLQAPGAPAARAAARAPPARRLRRLQAQVRAGACISSRRSLSPPPHAGSGASRRMHCPRRLSRPPRPGSIYKPAHAFTPGALSTPPRPSSGASRRMQCSRRLSPPPRAGSGKSRRMHHCMRLSPTPRAGSGACRRMHQWDDGLTARMRHVTGHGLQAKWPCEQPEMCVKAWVHLMHGQPPRTAAAPYGAISGCCR